MHDHTCTKRFNAKYLFFNIKTLQDIFWKALSSGCWIATIKGIIFRILREKKIFGEILILKTDRFSVKYEFFSIWISNSCRQDLSLAEMLEFYNNYPESNHRLSKTFMKEWNHVKIYFANNISASQSHIDSISCK